MVVGAVLSTTGFTAGAALGGPRYLVALAEHDELPPAFKRTHPRFATPSASIIATTGVTFVAAMLLDFNKLVDFTLIVIAVQYVGTCAAVPILRRARGTSAEPSWACFLGGWPLAAAGVAATLWLGSQGGLAELEWSVGTLALGFVLRLVFRLFKI